MKRHILTSWAAVAAVALACTAVQAQQSGRDAQVPAASERGSAGDSRGGATQERRGRDGQAGQKESSGERGAGTTGQAGNAPARSRSGPPDEMPPDSAQKSGQADTPRGRDSAKDSKGEQDRGAAKTGQSTQPTGQSTQQSQDRDRQDRGSTTTRQSRDRDRQNGADRDGRDSRDRADRDGRDRGDRTTTRRDRSERTGSQQRSREERSSRTGADDRRQGLDSRDSRDSRESRSTRDRDNRGSVTMSSEQRSQVSARFSARIDSMNVRPLSRSRISVSIGAPISRSVTLYDVPRDVVTIYPQYRGHKFVVVEDEIVIIAPGSRRVVATLPLSGSHTASGPAPRRTTGMREGGIRLSDSQRQMVRTTIMREPRCRTETRIDFVLFVPLPKTVEVCEFPPQLVSDVPEMRSYRYLVRGDEIIIVDPRENQVIEVIE